MAELEEVDLSKALAMLGKRVPWLANDIFMGKDPREQDLEIAEILEHAARLLRERAATRPRRPAPTAQVVSTDLGTELSDRRP